MEDRDVLGTSDSPDTEGENESIWQKVGSAVGLGGKKEKKEKPKIEGIDMRFRKSVKITGTNLPSAVRSKSISYSSNQYLFTCIWSHV